VTKEKNVKTATSPPMTGKNNNFLLIMASPATFEHFSNISPIGRPEINRSK